jgi:hypothetical protein
MRYLLMTTLFAAGLTSVAGAAEVSSSVSDGRYGLTARGALHNAAAGWSNSRTSSEFEYARNTTVGRDAAGKLQVAVSYSVRTVGGHTLAGHFSQAANDNQTASNHAQLDVTGLQRNVQLSGSIFQGESDLRTRVRSSAGAIGGAVNAWAKSTSQRPR